jgi:hypothetical protein
MKNGVNFHVVGELQAVSRIRDKLLDREWARVLGR